MTFVLMVYSLDCNQCMTLGFVPFSEMYFFCIPLIVVSQMEISFKQHSLEKVILILQLVKIAAKPFAET